VDGGGSVWQAALPAMTTSATTTVVAHWSFIQRGIESR
jgi:hypothetical protein